MKKNKSWLSIECDWSDIVKTYDIKPGDLIHVVWGRKSNIDVKDGLIMWVALFENGSARVLQYNEEGWAPRTDELSMHVFEKVIMRFGECI